MSSNTAAQLLHGESRSSRRQTFVYGAMFWTLLGLLSFSYRYLDTVVRHRQEPFQIKFIEEMTGTWGAGLLAVGVAYLVRRWRGQGWKRILHVPAVLTFSALHTTWNWGTRTVAFPLAGQGAYDYGDMPWRYLMELGNDCVGYSMVALAVTFFDQQRERQRQAVRVVALESEVAQAKLSALEMRLQPHFLYNALNTISSVMYEDVRVADRMLQRLSQLLRRTLETSTGLVTLREELETSALWSSIMTARFGDTLSFAQEIPEDLKSAMVPTLLLQPLLENAVRHGARSPELLTVTIAARCELSTLILEVRDNGVGWQGGETQALANGVGLSTTARRLQTLHGDDARLSLHTTPGGGATVRVELPWVTANA
ncbi:MAG: histidine kinase [Gemmatimonadaceae bacterium]|nr:histidine kinase [Gemmatimonadaceae bacterium]